MPKAVKILKLAWLTPDEFHKTVIAVMAAQYAAPKGPRSLTSICAQRAVDAAIALDKELANRPVEG